MERAGDPSPRAVAVALLTLRLFLQHRTVFFGCSMFFFFARLFVFLLFCKTKPQRDFLWGPYTIGFPRSLCSQVSRIRCTAINMSVGLICMKRVKLRTSTANQIGIQREHIRRIGYFIYKISSGKAHGFNRGMIASPYN